MAIKLPTADLLIVNPSTGRINLEWYAALKQLANSTDSHDPIDLLETLGFAGNDPFTKILLHFDGTDASTTITNTNAGGSDHTWTAAGNAQIDTAESKFGGASGLFDGTGDYVSTPDHADFTLGSSDFTVDVWFNCTKAAGSFANIIGQNDNVAANSSFFIVRNTINVITFRVSNGSSFAIVTGTTVFTDSVNTGWHHLACVRTSNILRMFIDGVQEGGNISFSGSVPDSALVFGVGSNGGTTANLWTGWIDEFRLSVGIARWTANFTPPTVAYGPK